MESVNEVIDEGNRKSILLGDLVQGVIINAHAKCTILFLDKYDRGTKRRYAGFDGSILEEVFYFLAQGIEFQGRHSVNWSPWWYIAWFQGNVMINVPFWREFCWKFVWKHIGEFLEEFVNPRVLFIGGDCAIRCDLT